MINRAKLQQPKRRTPKRHFLRRIRPLSDSQQSDSGSRRNVFEGLTTGQNTEIAAAGAVIDIITGPVLAFFCVF